MHPLAFADQAWELGAIYKCFPIKGDKNVQWKSSLPKNKQTTKKNYGFDMIFRNVVQYLVEESGSFSLSFTITVSQNEWQLKRFILMKSKLLGCKV